MEKKPEILKDGIKIYTSSAHYFGSDAILLADFAAPKKHEEIIDLGTGCGIIPMLWACDEPSLSITAVEIQAEAADLARRSAQEAGFNIDIILGDIKNIPELKERGIKTDSFHLVTMNPPYFSGGSGLKNPEKPHSIARHEGEGCNFEDVAAAAEKLLRFGGRFCFCHRPSRILEILTTLKKYRLEPKKLRFAHINKSKAPWLFLCEARKGGNPELNVMPPFLTYCDDGSFSEEHNNIYKLYKK